MPLHISFFLNTFIQFYLDADGLEKRVRQADRQGGEEKRASKQEKKTEKQNG